MIEVKMASSRKLRKSADNTLGQIEERGVTEHDRAEVRASARKMPKTGGILAALRRWPVSDLNFKRDRCKPRKIDL